MNTRILPNLFFINGLDSVLFDHSSFYSEVPDGIHNIYL